MGDVWSALSDATRREILTMLRSRDMTAGEIASAYELLEIKKFGTITRNVIYDGLYYETLKVYERRKKDE